MFPDLDDASVKLSTECVCRACDFIRGVTADEAQFLRQYIALLHPAKERYARYPGRNIRPAMLAELGRRWPNVFRPSAARVRSAMSARSFSASASFRLSLLYRTDGTKRRTAPGSSPPTPS
jgi:hypothetical protein